MIQLIKYAYMYQDRAAEKVRQSREPEDLLLAAVNYQEAGHYYRRSNRWREARETYLAAAANYQKSGLFNQAREARSWADSTKKHVSKWFAHPLPAVGLGAATILTYGVVYWLLDGVNNNLTNDPTASIWESLAFSGVTFATLGYGNLYPKTPMITLLAVSEAFLGIITLSLLIVALTTRRLYRLP